MPRMMAQKTIMYAGKKILAGTEFTALNRGDAAVLSTLRLAVSIKDSEPKLEVPDPVPVKEDLGPRDRKIDPKPKRRYHRRDMRAE